MPGMRTPFAPGRRAAALVAVAPILALGLAACGGSATAGSSGASSSSAASAASSGGSAAAVASVRIVGNNALRFVPMRVHVRVGRVRITLVDDGAYPHNVQVPSLGFTSPTVTGDPGQGQTTFTIDFPHPGTYAFRCQYHYTAGMVGTFVVS